MQTSAKTPTKTFSKNHHKSNHPKPYSANNKSLLQKITSHRPASEKDTHQSGKLIIAKLGDFVQNKCIFGVNCAHLRAQAECLFLHQKKDFEGLGIPLPEKYLQNEEPQKKSKQERKQDKIKEKAERQKRLKEKQQQAEERQKKQELQEQQQEQPVKVVQEKIMDQKQLIIQKILKPTQGQQLTLGHIYEQLNMVIDAIRSNQSNIYSQQFNFQQLRLTLHEIRKRLSMKFKKNKEFESIQKLLAEKESALVKKVIKNITTAYKDTLEELTKGQKWTNIDLRQIQQTFTTEDVVRVLNLKKDHPAILHYFERLFDEENGYPISFEPDQDEEVELNKGGLLPLTKFQILPIICPSFTFSRLFLSLDISFSEIRSFSEFASLMIPYQIAEKAPVQKTFTIDISYVTYNKFVDQIMTQFLNDYHEKMKGPAKEFQFGKIEQNLKKYRTFLGKYKIKTSQLNKENTFVLVVYNIRVFIEKIKELGIQENLDYDKIKKDRTMEQEQTYERVFLLKEFINIMSQGDQDKLKVIYATPQKKFKPKNYKTIFGSIDKFLIDEEVQKIDAQE